MKGLSVEKAFHTVTEAFQNCLKRFPVTVAFIFAFTAYLIHLTSISWTGEERLLFITGYYLSVGILLSLTLHLWSEEVKSRMWKTGIQLAAHALLIADAFLLYRYLGTESSWIEIGIAHTAAILTIGLSTFFLSFLREKNDIASWNFALNAVSSFAVTQIIGQTQPRTPLIRIPERHHTLPVPSAYSRISDSALHVCRPHSCQLGTAHRLGVMAHRSINDGVHRHSIRSVSRTP